MSRRRSLTAVCAALVATLGLAVVDAPAARAAATVNFSSGGGTRSAPASSPHIAGTVTAQSGCVIESIKLKLTTTEGHPLPGDNNIDGNDQGSQGFSWQPPLPKNGRYKISVETRERGSVVTGCPGSTATVDRDLWLEMAPAAPSLTSVQADAEQRSITVRWKRNGEADLIGYLIYRSFDGGPLEAIGGYAPDELQHFDRLDDAPNGDYRYEVRAIRPSADWYVGDGSRRPPAASPTGAAGSSGSATMTESSGPPRSDGGGSGDDGEDGGDAGTGTGGSSGRTGAGRTGSGNLRTTGKIDFSAFAAELDRVRQEGSPIEEGFGDRLPFRSRTTTITEQVPEQGLGEPIGNEQDRPTSLLMFAAGLLITAFVMHLLWLKGEVDRAPLEAVAPDGSVHPLVPVEPMSSAPAALGATAASGGPSRQRVRKRPPGAAAGEVAGRAALASPTAMATATATRVRRRPPR